MQLNEAFASEFQHESISAGKMLERVPFDKWDWKPHEKSMTLGNLATHIVMLASMPVKVTETNELDFLKRTPPKEIESIVELSERFKANVAQSIDAIKKTGNDNWMQSWTLRNGDHVIFTLPRAAAIRGFCFNHLIHHRGQLSVYLRLLNIPIPSIYGPSADEMN